MFEIGEDPKEKMALQTAQRWIKNLVELGINRVAISPL